MRRPPPQQIALGHRLRELREARELTQEQLADRVGYNGKYIFIYSWIMGDYSILKFEDFIMNSQLISGGVTLGYRFKFKENKVTRFIKNNKWYQML